MSMEESVKELEARREKARQMGGAERIAKQHGRGRLNARERVEKLLDPGSFIEFGILAQASMPELEKLSAADGRICGIGTIQGRKVAVIAQDRTVLGGSGGTIGHRKTDTQRDLALEGGYPVIELADESGGVRIQEVMGSREWLGEWLARATPHPGKTFTRRIPMVSAIMGECFGEPSWNAAKADFVVMMKGTAMGAAGPKMLGRSIGQTITAQELAGWELQAKGTGQADAVAENDEDCLEKVREFISYMPESCDEEPPFLPTDDDPGRRLENVEKIVPTQLNRGYDMYRLVKRIVDDGRYLPLKKDYAPSLFTCLARIGGRVVGIYGNNPMFNAGAPDVPASEKGVDFLCLCDSFNIPLISLMDIPGMFPGKEAEKLKLPTKIMVWVQAQNLVTVPRIHIIVRKYYAMGVMCMQGNLKRTDIIAAWPSARLSFVDPEIGLELAMESRIKEAPDPEAEKQRVREEWNAACSPWGAAGVYGLHDVIDPRDTRKFLHQTLEILRGNRQKVIGQHRLQDWPTGF
ncbi:MAG: carboxyl transferase domain-containing protein [Thermodesulfobacteriota bacterium]